MIERAAGGNSCLRLTFLSTQAGCQQTGTMYLLVFNNSMLPYLT